MKAISQEEENYARMSLLISGTCLPAVRAKFDSEFSPSCLAATIRGARQKIYTLQTNKIINQSQWDLLFPRKGDPNSNTFDITLMITLLTNLTKLANYHNKLPVITDTSVSADLARIKYYRNDISHNKDGKIDDSFFNTAWNDISQFRRNMIDGFGFMHDLYLSNSKYENIALYFTVNISLWKTDISERCLFTKIRRCGMIATGTTIHLSSNEVDAVGRLGGQDMVEQCEELKSKRLDYSTIPWNIKVQISQILEDWETKDKSFFETKAAKHVLECVRTKSCVTITASSGVGKTATLQHVALKMREEGYDVVLVTSPLDIVNYYNPAQKTLFVIDDFCGTYSINQSYLNCLQTVMERLDFLIKKNRIKLVVACRLQVCRDETFESLSSFKSCVCNLLSQDLCLSQPEKKSIAEIYLKTKTSDIIKYCDLYDFFPLLCKLCKDNPKLNITDFFQNPFSVYEKEIDTLRTQKHFGKYCALVMLVMFNNRLSEKMLTDAVNPLLRSKIENIFQACKLDKGTSPLILIGELKSLEHTYIKKEQGVYRTIHDKIFDFLVSYFGQKIINYLISYSDPVVIMQRFLLETKEDSDRFITIIPTDYHEMYIQRMISDWMNGNVQCVFNNINMKIPEFRERFLRHLKALSISDQRQLAHTRDIKDDGTVLLMCCQYDNIPFIKWCLYHGVDVNQCNCFGTSPLYKSAEKGHTEVIQLLVDTKSCWWENRTQSQVIIPATTSVFLFACLIVFVYFDFGALWYWRLVNNVVMPIFIFIFICSFHPFSALDINKCTDEGKSPLLIASEKNRLEIVNLLLVNRANVNICSNNGLSPLFFACLKGNKELVKVLLDSNADVNKCSKEGLSPLVMSCLHNQIEIVELLCECDVEIDKCAGTGASNLFSGYIDKLVVTASPLFIASMGNHIEIVKILLNKKADINKCTADGTSPLLVACIKNHIEIVKLLLDNDADVNKCTVYKAFPLLNAYLGNHTEIISLLLQKGASFDRIHM